MRGTAFTFRTYDSQRDAVQNRWSRIFAVASLITPVILGMCVGTIAAGRIPAAAASEVAAMGFHAAFVAPWLTGFGIAVGLMTLSLFAHLAAVYLTVEARTAPLQDDFRTRALIAQGCMLGAAVVALILARSDAPAVSRGLLSGWRAAPLFAAVAIAAAISAWLLVRRRFVAARVAAAAQASFILWGWPLAQFPYLLPAHTTIDAAAAPRVTLRLVLIALAAGGLLLFPSLAYLFRVFKSRNTVAGSG
jgi:cytochrome d ubiquinol oxidase subunit II